MIVKRLQFDGFRNLQKGEIFPHSGVNVVFGTNAQGKTNLLEAIWLMSGNKSFRGSRDSELIGFNREYAGLKIDFFSEERDQNAELLLRQGKKEVKINGVKKKSAAALSGKLCVVVFSPEHLSLVSDHTIIIIWAVKIFFVQFFCVFLPPLLNIFCFWIGRAHV